MKRTIYAILAVAVTVASCKQEQGVEEKKLELATLKRQYAEIHSRINVLERELEQDSLVDENSNIALISMVNVEKKPFKHSIEVRGEVKSRKNVFLSSEIPGNVRQVLVREGQSVKKGQILLVQDATTLRKAIAELKSSLAMAKTVFEKQENLWVENNIGTELQYLQSKNNKESLELKLETTKAELAKTQIKAPFTGVIDKVEAREGELLSPGMPVIRIVSLSDMFIRADVSEAHVGKFKNGQEVDIRFANADTTLLSSITAIGRVVNKQNRTFELEVEIPNKLEVIPNMVAILNVCDYKTDNAIVVPTNLIMSDAEGKYLFEVTTNGKNKVAKRLPVQIGVTYKEETEVVSGLDGNEQIIAKGVQEITNGALIKLAANN